jgi:acetoacetyl-CoA synthetase
MDAAIQITNEDMMQPLWTPTEEKIKNANITAFITHINGKYGQNFSNYNDIWQWSCENNADFWSELWDFCNIIGEKGDIALQNPNNMPIKDDGAAFFPQAKVNFAENLLRRRDDSPALIFTDETGTERIFSFNELYDSVSRLAQALKAAGIVEGDRVAGYMPNMPETIIGMLATASLGAIWSSASPDFGVQGVIDRFGQIEPKTMITVDGYYYNGKTIDVLAKVKDVLPHIPSIQTVITVPFAGSNTAPMEQITMWDEFLGDFTAGDITFNRVGFNHPLYIMFSSGTTGVPKCIVHGHGGCLLQQVKEHALQCDTGRDDRVFYFTTCGWMMWNWLVAALACEATLLLYDGSPFYPSGNVLWDFTSRHNCTFFGTSAKYIDAMKVHDIRPKDQYDLSSLKAISSTGSPLVHESFDFVYDAIKDDLHLASISGGTDIVSCFVLGSPINPVYRGEIQVAGLGMAVDSFDNDGKPMPVGESGELVCTKPFPCMPVKFWNDEDGAKYKAAYFERFDNVWAHGDWIEKTPHGGFIIHGRSDATLNPGGVRIGTAEIYRQVEQIEEVTESIAVGQDWDGDVRVILFVTLRDGATLNDDLIARIKTQIRQGATPRHVPAKVIQVTDIPRTKSGKITELAVRDVIHGRPIKNVEALANPEALELYKDLAELS